MVEASVCSGRRRRDLDEEAGTWAGARGVPEEVTPALWSPRSVLETASSREALAGCTAGELERLQSCWAHPEPRVVREGSLASAAQAGCRARVPRDQQCLLGEQ